MGPKHWQKLWAILCLPLHFCVTAVTFSQIPGREFEPVIVTGDNFPQFNGVAIDELFLFSYDGSIWRQIPFQIDERDANDSYFGDDTAPIANGVAAGGLDGNDELVFLLKDAGQINRISWIDDISSVNYVRYEIPVRDPITGDRAYVYLYRSQSLSMAGLTDYVEYVSAPPDDRGNDEIKSMFYEIDNGSNGLAQGLKILAANGGNGQDLLDIVKVRARASLFVSVNVTENNLVFEGDDEVLVRDGLIRVIRKVDQTLKVSVLFSTIRANFVTPPTFYYPFSSIIEIEVPQVSDATIQSGRLSIDMNDASTGMTFRSAKNTNGVPVDGQTDELDKTIDDLLPDRNWMSLKGEQGTLVHFFPLDVTTGGSRSLYYKDNSNTDGDDTGDKKSYADVGVALADNIDTPFTLGYKTYYLSKDSPDDIGNTIEQFETNPLQIETPVAQDFGAVPVELVVFEAEVQHTDVILTWKTATESNNFGFDVERRPAATEAWQKIGFVAGQGTTTELTSYEFVDRNLQAGTYDYRLKQIDTDGAFEYLPAVTAVIGVPETFALHQNYPNPFNPTTTIQYEIAAADDAGSQRTVLKIYNLLGKEVRTLVDTQEQPGFYTAIWDGNDNTGAPAGSGVYIYRLQSGRFVETRKMALIR